jgi:germination protein M
MKYALVIVPAAVFCAAVGFLVASCGASDATPAGPVPSVPEAVTETGTATVAPPSDGEATITEPQSETETAVGEEESAATLTYAVWFANDDGLFVTSRSQPATPRVGTAAVRALLAGPTAYERDYGLSTAIPEGTKLLGLAIADGVARVDLTSEFESGGGTLSMQTRLAQVVYTLTQFETVDRVTFSLDGEEVEVLGGEGIVIDHPLGRNDYAELLPPILVEAPALGSEQPIAVDISGSANVFEANVTAVLLDAKGRRLARQFTTATCGTGCRGDFELMLPYDVAERQVGTLVVHDDDASGGAEGFGPHEVRIPVVLVP